MFTYAYMRVQIKAVKDVFFLKTLCFDIYQYIMLTMLTNLYEYR
nr:MAG TPA: hypothetical protein [Caudoviricetes sp.]